MWERWPIDSTLSLLYYPHSTRPLLLLLLIFFFFSNIFHLSFYSSLSLGWHPQYSKRVSFDIKWNIPSGTRKSRGEDDFNGGKERDRLPSALRMLLCVLYIYTNKPTAMPWFRGKNPFGIKSKLINTKKIFSTLIYREIQCNIHAHNFYLTSRCLKIINFSFFFFNINYLVKTFFDSWGFSLASFIPHNSFLFFSLLNF